MNEPADEPASKRHRDENFPVASVLIQARHRGAIMAFYRFARTADDIADHATADPDEKLRELEAMRATLVGETDANAPALALRQVLGARRLTSVHGLDLLEAFRRDVVKSRYASWSELMDYCRYSAAPVGRMVLDIHGEPSSVWPASDALCAALQVINHLQDCGKDYRELDRVYLPTEDLSVADLDVAALAASRASPGLRLVIANLARRTQELLYQSRPLAQQVRNRRLRLEIAVIQRLAEDLASRLMVRDPLSQRVHHRKLEFIGLAGSAVGRLVRPPRSLRSSSVEVTN